MKEWDTSDAKPSYLDLAYNAERSIQDEIKRLSSSEMVTVIASYLVMFVYIAISLGKIVAIKQILVNQT